QIGFAQRIFSEADADFVPCLRASRCAASASLKILCLITSGEFFWQIWRTLLHFAGSHARQGIAPDVQSQFRVDRQRGRPMKRK
ncbi:hypothetical protein, partial [Paraburkholderia aspalathi]|uniref:hypothetical protein n=1 Tax=Paraburkholderia aspalathi TaxID=1324617 RepID=UPI001BAC6799